MSFGEQLAPLSLIRKMRSQVNQFAKIDLHTCSWRLRITTAAVLKQEPASTIVTLTTGRQVREHDRSHLAAALNCDSRDGGSDEACPAQDKNLRCKCHRSIKQYQGHQEYLQRSLLCPHHLRNGNTCGVVCIGQKCTTFVNYNTKLRRNYRKLLAAIKVHAATFAASRFFGVRFLIALGRLKGCMSCACLQKLSQRKRGSQISQR